MEDRRKRGISFTLPLHTAATEKVKRGRVQLESPAGLALHEVTACS